MPLTYKYSFARLRKLSLNGSCSFYGFQKSISLFTEFTNCNLSLRLIELTLLFVQWCWRAWVSSYCSKSYLKRRDRLFSTVTWVLQLHTVWNPKNIGLLTLLTCEAASLTVFTTMFHKEQQTSDNLTVLSLKYLINLALVVPLRRISSHSWNHSQTIFSIEIWRQNHGCDYHLTDFFWKNMVASSFCHDRKSAFRGCLGHLNEA